LNTYVAPIALGATAPATGAAVTMAGWGTQSVNILSFIIMQLCNTAWVDCCSAPIAASTMICAKAEGQGACKWDEGGPLFTGSGSSATQVGLIIDYGLYLKYT